MEMAYIAAFLDCDGTIGIGKVRNKRAAGIIYSARIAFYSQNARVLVDISERLGMNQILVPKTSLVFTYQLHGKKADEVIRCLLPFLRIKREQALLLLKFQNLKHYGEKHRYHKTHTPERYAQYEALYLEMKRLNHVDSKWVRRVKEGLSVGLPCPPLRIHGEVIQ